MAIRIRLRELRTARGLTQVQLAQMCGMPQSTISRIESGTTTGVDFETLDRVAKALEIHPSELIGFTKVTFDHKGKSWVVDDITREVESIPAEATTMWGIRGTRMTFAMGPDLDAGAVIKEAKKLVAKRK